MDKRISPNCFAREIPMIIDHESVEAISKKDVAIL